MRRGSRWMTLGVVLLAVVVGCHDHDHDHGAEAAPHAHGAHEEHGGHAGHHGGGAHDERPAESVTVWTDRTELFMEYTALVVGEESTTAAHVTELTGFTPLTEGTFTLTVTSEHGDVWRSSVDAPARAGIFRPAIRPTKAGPCELKVTVEAEGLRDSFSAGPCTVHPSVEAAVASEADSPTGLITYLKEQQWKTDFATAPVAVRPIQGSVSVPGEVRAAAGREAKVLASVPGRVAFAADEGGGKPPHPGMQVAEGQLLATIVPRVASVGDPSSVRADQRAARAELKAARVELDRVERLLADGAVAQRRVAEARARVEVAKARYAGASGRARHFRVSAEGEGEAPARFEMRAPIGGILVAVDVASGESVEEGQPLFTVLDPSRVWLVAHVFEGDVPRVQNTTSAWFEIEGHPRPFVVGEGNGGLVTIGPVVDPVSRTVPVIFDVDNGDGRLRVGQFAQVHVATGSEVEALTIPESAILTDGGRPVAFVMVEGEAFARRALLLGRRARGIVEVREGLEAGERVVTRGAYEVKLAASDGAIPSHGHVH